MLQKNAIFNLSTDKNTGYKYRKCDASLKFQIPMIAICMFLWTKYWINHQSINQINFLILRNSRFTPIPRETIDYIRLNK